MSLANKITLARGALIPLVLLFLFLDQRYTALSLFLLASFGDVLDGMVARRRGEVSVLGKALDPAVDKALYFSLLAALTARGEIRLLALVLFSIPQIGLGIGALILRVRARTVQGAQALGKAAATLTFAAVVFLLLPLPEWTSPYRLAVLYLAIALSYLAALDYLRAALRAKKSHDRDTPGTPAEPPPQNGSVPSFPDE